MLRKAIALAVLLLFVFQGSAFATTAGEIVFRDAIYGAIIGALLGGAVYLMDPEDAGEKFGIGIAAGTIGGVIFGVMETRGIVRVEKGKGKISILLYRTLPRASDANIPKEQRMAKIENIAFMPLTKRW